MMFNMRHSSHDCAVFCRGCPLEKFEESRFMNPSMSVSAYSSAIIFPFLVLLLLANCVPRAVVNTGEGAEGRREVGGYETAVGRFGILEPEVMMYDVSAGGILEYRDDWSGGASRRAAVSAAVKLNLMGYESMLLPDAAGGATEIFRLKTNMRYHASAFQSQFFSNYNIIAEIDSITYSVGPLQTLCDAFGIDGVLYIYGFAEKFSEERPAGADEPERTFMAVILVEKDGRVSWYRHLLTAGGLDIRTDEHSMRMIGAMFQ